MRAFPMMFLMLPGCVSAPPVDALSAPSPSFDAIRFFEGRTRGDGEARVALSSVSKLTVQGSGRIEPDGTLVLDQLIERQGAEPEQRQWRIREVTPGSYRGTLSTAEGPVAGRAEGNRLHLRYKLASGLDVRQWIYLQPGGRTAINRLTLSKFGVPVAAVEETIRKVD
jgi:hypothetical protein